VSAALIESELFGHESGAFTGAAKARAGRFEHAHQGTLFLDEIEAMPAALQAKLLRVLQEQEIEPLGANRLIRINVRVIAATSLDLAARVADGRFRADLYYRLNVLQLSVPPLRARLDDLPLLTERLLDDISLRIGLPLELDDGALAVLAGYAWPGNVRELRNVLERAVMMNETRRLTAEQLARVLPPAAAKESNHEAPATARSPRLAHAIADAERHAILAALESTHGNKLAAAQQLGISRAALYQKLSALGMANAK
jgi:transcriptional regulator with PAS, ATPase and Fis domain